MTADWTIALQHVSFRYSPRSRWIFEDVSLSMQGGSGAGGVVAIMGPSGSGKSTLLRLVGQLEEPLAGEVVTPRDAVVAHMTQEPVFFEHLSVLENARYFHSVGIHRNRFEERLFDAMTVRFQLEDVLRSKMSIESLSGGERQRLALLRALSIQPNVLLLDEPCNALDAGVKWHFLALLRNSVSASGLLALYVTHHADETLAVADRVVYLAGSRLGDGRQRIFEGSVDRFVDSPATVEIAQTFADGPLNIIRCGKDAGHDLRLIGSTESTGQYLIVVPPQAIGLSPEGGEEACVAAATNAYWYGTLKKSGVPLVGARDGKTIRTGTHRVSLRGPVGLFDAESHNRVGSADIQPDGGDGWRLRSRLS